MYVPDILQLEYVIIRNTNQWQLLKNNETLIYRPIVSFGCRFPLTEEQNWLPNMKGMADQK